MKSLTGPSLAWPLQNGRSWHRSGQRLGFPAPRAVTSQLLARRSLLGFLPGDTEGTAVASVWGELPAWQAPSRPVIAGVTPHR